MYSTPRSSKVKNQEINVSPNLSENTPRKQLLRTALKNIRRNFKKKLKFFNKNNEELRSALQN